MNENVHGHEKVLAWMRKFMRGAKKYSFRSVEFRKEIIGKGWRLVLYVEEK